jgi:D-glycero-alpha-D-manno-heptose 1-phosphate guanylyltransferase
MNSNHPSEMLILAGGFGTRLRSQVSNVPKPMAPVTGRPFLEYLLNYWIGQGIKRFVLSTGHLGHVIQTHIGKSYRNADIDYIHEKLPLGTGGALRLALNVVSWQNEMALIANGDTWFPVDLAQIYCDASQQKTPITLALKFMEKNDRYGVVEVGDNRKIKSFGLKSEGCALINAGCYLLNITTLKQALANKPESFSFENDFLVDYAANGHVGSSIQDRPFLDIGIPEDYQKASNLLF